MKKFTLIAMLSLITMAVFSQTTWTETCGTSVSKIGTSWPYANQFTGWDHNDDCTYNGYYASVRYLSLYSDNGPHVYLQANKDNSRFNISGLPGGTDVTFQFDMVLYQQNATDNSYATTDQIGLKLNDVEVELPAMTDLASQFTTITVELGDLEEGSTIEFFKKENNAVEVRLDNFVLTFDAATPVYFYLDIAAGDGGTVDDVSGLYEEGEEVTFTATPNDGYQFVQWSDGVEDATRTVQMNDNIELTAEFELIPNTDGGCYSQFEGKTGSQIIVLLYNSIKDHTKLSYGNVRADKARVDIVNDLVVDYYGNCDFSINAYEGGTDDTWTKDAPECGCYNREHSLPKNWWGGSETEPMYTDLHHILPTDKESNETRSNYPLGEVSNSPSWTNTAGAKLGYGTFNTTVFEPLDEYKGDLARIYFYMVTCYRDKNFTNSYGAKVFTYSNNIAGFTSTARDLFLKWHRDDPVSQRELDRNDGVEGKQGNRNPYVDMPELVEYIWGTNSSNIYSCSATAMDEVAKESVSKVTKVIENGAFYIVMPDGTRYTLIGTRVQ